MEVTGKACSVKVIAHSQHENGPELFTLQIRFPRIVHSEFLTHRVFSRNASSSRAIPVQRMLEQIRNEPAMPARFGGNKPGMQDRGAEHDAPVMLPPHMTESFDQYQLVTPDHTAVYENVTERWCVSARTAWAFSAWVMAGMSEAYMDAGYHKQIANRLIEFAQYMSVVVTGTDWKNFFALRDHDAADPTMHDLAHTMRAAMEMSPVCVNRTHMIGNDLWHLPYIHDSERLGFPLVELQAMSVARCARVSYLNHDRSEPDSVKDIELCNQLQNSGHWSPFEHQASPGPTGLLSNITGWRQLRKMVEANPKYLGVMA